MNIKNYPGSASAQDSLGDLYAAMGDNANAILSYKKSLSLKETFETREKLEKLHEK